MSVNDSINQRLAWLVETPFSFRDEKRYGMRQLARLNWKVTVIDCSEIFSTLKSANYDSSLGKSEDYVYLRPLSMNSLIDYIEKLDPEFVIDANALDFSGKRAYAKKLLLRLYIQIRFTHVSLRLTSSHHVNRNRLGYYPYLIKSLFRYPLTAPWNCLIPKITLVAGRTIAENTFSKTIVSSHSYDYDDYLESYRIHKEECQGKNLRKILFLDQKGVFGVDVMASSNSGYVNSDKIEYYEHVNYFLAKISERLDMFVEIQLHPKSYLSRDYFKHKISDKALSEAVSESMLIIGHSSASLQMAILFRKPIVLLGTEAIKGQAKVRADMKRLSALLGINIVEWDKPEEILSIPDINNRMYSEYLDRFIVHPDGHHKLYTWEILSKSLSEYYQKHFSPSLRLFRLAAKYISRIFSSVR